MFTGSLGVPVKELSDFAVRWALANNTTFEKALKSKAMLRQFRAASQRALFKRIRPPQPPISAPPRNIREAIVAEPDYPSPQPEEARAIALSESKRERQRMAQAERESIVGETRAILEAQEFGISPEQYFARYTPEFKSRSIDGGRIRGGALTPGQIKAFIDASYADRPDPRISDDRGDWILDQKLSIDTAKVYSQPSTGRAIVVHRGTQGAADWANNLAWGLGGYKLTDRYKKGAKTQEAAERKYGAKNISTLGHSQGGILAKELGANTKEVIILNPATGMSKPLKNQYTIRSDADIVSAAHAPMSSLRSAFGHTSGNRTITIPAESRFDILGEHSGDILDRLPQDEMIGRGIVDKIPLDDEEWEISLLSTDDGDVILTTKKPDQWGYRPVWSLDRDGLLSKPVNEDRDRYWLKDGFTRDQYQSVDDMPMDAFKWYYNNEFIGNEVDPVPSSDYPTIEDEGFGSLQVRRINLNGKDYVIEVGTNWAYDAATKKHIGIWDPDEKKIRPLKKQKEEPTSVAAPAPVSAAVVAKEEYPTVTGWTFRIGKDKTPVILEQGTLNVYDFLSGKMIGQLTEGNKFTRGDKEYELKPSGKLLTTKLGKDAYDALLLKVSRKETAEPVIAPVIQKVAPPPLKISQPIKRPSAPAPAPSAPIQVTATIAPPVSIESLKEKTNDQLKVMCERLGIAKYGNKQQIIDRIVAKLQQTTGKGLCGCGVRKEDQEPPRPQGIDVQRAQEQEQARNRLLTLAELQRNRLGQYGNWFEQGLQQNIHPLQRQSLQDSLADLAPRLQAINVAIQRLDQLNPYNVAPTSPELTGSQHWVDTVLAELNADVQEGRMLANYFDDVYVAGGDESQSDSDIEGSGSALSREVARHEAELTAAEFRDAYQRLTQSLQDIAVNFHSVIRRWQFPQAVIQDTYDKFRAVDDLLRSIRPDMQSDSPTFSWMDQERIAESLQMAEHALTTVLEYIQRYSGEDQQVWQAENVPTPPETAAVIAAPLPTDIPVSAPRRRRGRVQQEDMSTVVASPVQGTTQLTQDSLEQMPPEDIDGGKLKGKAYPYKIQTILFSKPQWTKQKASAWLRKHKYSNKGVDDKPDTLRYRQVNPDYIEKLGYTRYITKPLGDSGVSLVIVYKG